MKTLLAFYLAAIVVVSNPVPNAAQTTTAQNAGPQNTKEIEAFLDHVLQQDSAAFSAAAFVMVKDSTILFQKGYGYSDREKQQPVVPDQTVFYAASISKLFVATAVMQLVESGRLRLDEDLNHYLKKFQVVSPYPQPVTMAQLLTHTGGIDERWLGALARPNTPVPALEDYFTQHPPRCATPPGEQINYSNHGMALAGYIVEAVSGKHFDEYVEQKIFQPLGMLHSSFRQPLPAALAADLPNEAPTIIPYPAGSLTMTTTDMAAFMIAQLNGGRLGNQRILQEATISEMHRQHFSPHPQIPGVAYGFFESIANGRRALYHTGDRGHHALLYLLPNEHVGFYFVCIAPEEKGIALREKLTQAFLDHYYPAKEKFVLPPPPADFQQRAQRFTGLSRPTSFSRTTIAKLPALMADFRITDNGNGTLTAHPPWGPMKMVEVAPLLFRIEDGAYMAFREDPNDNLSHFVVAGGIGDPSTAERIPWYESGALHLRLAIFGFVTFILRWVIWPIRNFIQRLRQKTSALESKMPRLGWQISGWVSGLIILCPLLMLGWALTKPWPVFGVPPILIIVLSVILLATGLGLVLPVFAVLAWKNKYWSITRRIHFSVIAITALLMLPWLYYWNLLGFHF